MENSIKNSKLLNPIEVAKMLNISRATLYRIVGRRQIPFYKVGGMLRFSEKNILEYLEKNQTGIMEWK